RTGAPWRDLPERYGPWKTAHERLRLWTKDGTWQKILDKVIVKDDSVGDVEWVISVDSSVVRAHQHAAGARKKVPLCSSSSRWKSGLVEGAVAEHGVEDVDTASGQAGDGGDVVFAFGAFAGVVGA